MGHFSKMFVLFAVPQEGTLYSVRVARLQAFAPTLEFEIRAALLYDWLKRHCYELNAISLSQHEDVIVAHVSEAQLKELGFISEPFLEGSFGPVRVALRVPNPLILPDHV